MIRRYLEFVNESMDLILESDVVYSDRFRLTLSKIETPLSKVISSIENKDLPVRSNFFDISLDKNDTVSFIPDRRAQEILGDKKETVRFTGSEGGWLTYNKKDNGEYKNKTIFNLLGYVPVEGAEVYKPAHDVIGEIVKKVVSPTSGKTFVWVKFPDGEGVYNNEKLRDVDESSRLVWTTSRQEIRIGRAIRALLATTDVKFGDKDIEEFVNLYKAYIDRINDKFSLFEEIKGEKIGFWYNSKNYLNRKGNLGSSCMSGVRASYFDMYISNPDVCSLVIFKSIDDDSKIIGRALLWTLIDGKRLMDRIYTSNESDTQLFKDYARENGWYHKRTNGSSPSNQAVAPDGSNVDLPEVVVNIKPGEYERYPYLDTLKYWSMKGTLSTKGGRDTYALESTDGSYYDDDDDECYECNGSGRLTCDTCDGDGKWTCDTCNGDGEVGDGEEKKKCPDCKKGKVTCDECDGDGYVDCYECQ